MNKISNYWKSLPDWIKTGIWISASAFITALGSYLLERPELFQYYGVINFILFALKEINKNRNK
jgi:hypothetical protein